MAAGTYDFTIEQGTTLDLEIVWKDNSGDPVNLTGYTARMQVRETVSSDPALAEWNTEGTKEGDITLGTTDGTILISADAATTAAFNWPVPTNQINQQGVYDIELISGGGTVTRLLQGTVTLSPEVTR